MKYLRRLWLFLRIVWRPWDRDYKHIGVKTAWRVACIVWE